MNLDFNREDYYDTCFNASLILGYVAYKRWDGLSLSYPVLQGLSKFDIDKTMRFALKLWNEAMIPDPRKKEGLICSLGIKPDHNDKHGHRIAFASSIEKGWKPVLDFMQSLDNGEKEAKRFFLSKPKEKSYGPKDVLVPQVDQHRLNPLLRSRRLTTDDVRFLEKVGSACSLLDAFEMISIGRHETAAGTRDSILWELSRWKEWVADTYNYVSENSSYILSSPSEAANYLWQCYSFARECALKTGTLEEITGFSDRKNYNNAILKLLSEGSPVEERVKRTIKAVQCSTSSIWKDAQVATLGFAGFAIWCCSVFSSGTLLKSKLFSSTQGAMRLEKLDAELIKNGYDDLKRCMTIDRSNIPAVFTRDWLIKNANGLPLVDMSITPEDLWAERCPVLEFISHTKAIHDHIIENFVDPEVFDISLNEA